MFETISLIIKCPASLNAETQDFCLDCPLTFTVATLKKTLQARHPCNPDPADQRIIFRGRIVEDSAVLGDLAAQQIEQGITLHMVLKSGQYRPHLHHHEPQHREEKRTPLKRNPSTIFSVVDRHGRGRITDLGRALIFDGHRFYTLQHSALGLSSALSPSQQQSTYLPAAHPPTPTVTRSEMWDTLWRFLVDFDYAALVAFVVKVGLVVVLFAKGASPTRIALVTLVGMVVFLIQSGFLPMDPINRLWNTVLGARAVTAAVPPSDNPPWLQADEGVGRAVSPANPVISLVEVFTTFFLSMFPSDPPLLNDARPQANPRNV